MLRQKIHYSGRVQGVGFRYTVKRLAGGRAVTGFVRNLPDGRVELIVEGSADEIDALLRAIREHFADSIADVAIQAGSATGEFEGFEIRR